MCVVVVFCWCVVVGGGGGVWCGVVCCILCVLCCCVVCFVCLMCFVFGGVWLCCVVVCVVCVCAYVWFVGGAENRLCRQDIDAAVAEWTALHAMQKEKCSEGCQNPEKNKVGSQTVEDG